MKRANKTVYGEQCYWRTTQADKTISKYNNILLQERSVASQ